MLTLKKSAPFSQMHAAIIPLNKFFIKLLSFTSFVFHMGFKSFDLFVAFCLLIP